MPMLRTWRSQQVSEADSSGNKPNSRRRLTSYKPIAKNGPSNKQPDAMDMVYSGLDLNTAPSTRPPDSNTKYGGG
jgi:hypothetical protein